MKNRFKQVCRGFTATATGLAGMVGIAAMEMVASGQVASATLFPLTNMPPTLAGSGVSFLTNATLQAQVVPLTRNCCLSIIGRCVASAAGGNELLSGSFSNDGTNFGVAPFVLTSPLATAMPTNAIGQPTVTVWTNWPQSYLSSFCAVTFTLATNTGAGTVTNLAWVANRATLNIQTY